ncbi:hypothetical protein [Rhizobium leguminosarum]|uniref:hypothetical protein n=1 Tax=Rhizobium leguminosarum TaxID=384 RepID=UPI001FE22124|nr:hypothetical protein [Rhizobium leguminosarum]
MTITSETSSVPGFVAELVRAANEVDRLTAREIESLLPRAMTTVRDLHEQAGIPGSGTDDDAIVRLDIVAKGVVTFSQANISASLREAADLVRTLWIIGDSGTIVTLKPPRQSNSDRSLIGSGANQAEPGETPSENEQKTTNRF